MQDIEILLENKPGTLALMGETLGKNKISFEGGGVFQNGDVFMLVILLFIFKIFQHFKQLFQLLE